jgi:hypothetical protein
MYDVCAGLVHYGMGELSRCCQLYLSGSNIYIIVYHERPSKTGATILSLMVVVGLMPCIISCLSSCSLLLDDKDA